MEATTNSLVFRTPAPAPGQASRRYIRRRFSPVLATSKSDSEDRNLGSKIVDENMIVLRKRIRLMKMMEENYEAPSHWMEWEKKYYRNYDTDICELVGQLQRFLISTRPSVAVGLMMLVGFSVPTSVLVVLLKLFELGTGILHVIVHN